MSLAGQGTMGNAHRATGRLAGLGFAVGAAALWGLGGVAAQELFEHHAIEPPWLVGIRMTGAGLLLLVVVRPAWPHRHWLRLLIFALFGMTVTQYTWFAAIDHSNVATATFIQYSGVAMTAGWQLLRHEISATLGRMTALAAAVAGVALLVLGRPDGIHALQASPLGVVFALVSAVAFAVYMLGSPRLVRAISLQSVSTWGLIMGGIPMLLSAPPWNVRSSGSPLTVTTLTAFVVVASTAVAFSISLAALRRISPTDFAVTSTLEPAVAGLAGVLLLGVKLSALQYVGGAATVGAVLLLATARRKQTAHPGRITRLFASSCGWVRSQVGRR